MIELSTRVFEVLRKDEDFVLYRGRTKGDAAEPAFSSRLRQATARLDPSERQSGDCDRAKASRNQILVLSPALEYPRPESLKRLEHEYSFRKELDTAWAARPIGITRHWNRPVLVQEDPGGELLGQLLGQPLDLETFLRLAISLASAIGQLHQRGVIHKDIKPANIIVNSAADKVWLIGFGNASRLRREHRSSDPARSAGTLAYLAPEQTGRMNRSVDSRSDLYSLGVTLYEVLTGSLPFTASNSMEWVHCHIARQPLPPSDRLKNVPGPVSAMIMKLLAKTAEERYQTAAGLESDLRRCLDGLFEESRPRDPLIHTDREDAIPPGSRVPITFSAFSSRIQDAGNAIAPFPLGEHDKPDRLLIPEKLYGRDRERKILIDAFDRVATSGRMELVLVSGYSGVGKSSIVYELQKGIALRGGIFSSGKFDRYKRDVPYATLAQAFQGIVRQILTESEEAIGGWRDAVREVVGTNGQLLVNLIPELELIIGKQPPVTELPLEAAQNRFQMVLVRFLGVFARATHPVALFLDDLQWLDTATLELLNRLVTESDVRHLLLIGAYRDNEVGPADPLGRTLEKVREAGLAVQEIILAPLSVGDLEQLVADTLRCEPHRARPLAQLVHEKTGGNPFFANQFLEELADDGLLAFDRRSAVWTWDLLRIQARGYTDNVVELMTGKLKRQPQMTQQALKRLACLGNSAKISTLKLVYAKSEESIQAELLDAVRAGFVFKFDGVYTFLHDRIQEAAYWLTPESERAALHLNIGRVLISSATSDEIEEKIFDIVNQLNRATPLITDSDERRRVSELNFIAGKRAKISEAYVSALNYFVASEAFLAEDCWEQDHAFAFEVALNRAECEFRIGLIPEAENRLSRLTSQAANSIEGSAAACLRIVLYMTEGEFDRTVEVFLEYLRHVGVEWSAHPTKDDVEREYAKIWRQVGARTIEQLVDLPLMSDPRCRATLDVLSIFATPAWYVDENLHDLVGAYMANLSLEHGNSDGSCHGYALLGRILGSNLGRYQAGFRFGKLAVDLIEKRGLHRFKARVYSTFGHHIAPWARHLHEGRIWNRLAFDAAKESGDLTYAVFSSTNMIANLLAGGDPLEDVQREAEECLEFTRKTRFDLLSDCVIAALRLVRTLRGLTPKFGSFNDADFDEGHFEQHLRENPHLAPAACRYWIRKLQARFYADDYASAVAAAAKAHLLHQRQSFIEIAEYPFYSALAHAALYSSASPDERVRHLQALVSNHKQLVIWKENCPENFGSSAAIVEAEIARIEGRDADAERLYEEAISSARQQGFVQNEAVAHEAAARFYSGRGLETIARGYLQNAWDSYLRWGALGKVKHLEQRYPNLSGRAHPPGGNALRPSLEQVDLLTLAKASQAISSELDLAKLVETLLVIAIQNAGAQRGILVLLSGDQPQIEAEAITGQETIAVNFRRGFPTPADLPDSILRYVIRTQESVILDDASAPNPFSADEYIKKKQARSVLCLPLIKQASLKGVLYLENNLASHVFTPDRISVLRLLVPQASISLDHARLVAELTQEINDRKKAEEALRASEERWSKLAENSSAGIALIAPGGRFIAANLALREMLGYTEHELQASTILNITHEEDRTATEVRVAEANEGQRRFYRLEKRFLRKDGSIVWADVSTVFVPAS
ncbi:MAG: AAA family ATPase, partial [Verrucomicrobia bacterium]|nr:AAA family ATPase [Verrucomicrobiota bacterium]